MTQQRWRSNRARITTIAPDTIFHFITFSLLYSSRRHPSTKPQNELPSAPADSERDRRGGGVFFFYAYELPTHLPTRKTASRRILRALHCTGVQHCASPPPHSPSSTPPKDVTTILHFSFFRHLRAVLMRRTGGMEEGSIEKKKNR